jgi:hypothetical protein
MRAATWDPVRSKAGEYLAALGEDRLGDLIDTLRRLGELQESHAARLHAEDARAANLRLSP